MSLWRPPHSVLGCGTHAHMMPWGALPGWLRLGHTLNGLNQLAAAAAAKSLQLCPTLCNPIDGSPPGFPKPWDSPGKSTGVGCHFLLRCMKVKVKSLSRVRLLETPWTAAYQAPLSMGFSRQEYWSGVPLPAPIVL